MQPSRLLLLPIVVVLLSFLSVSVIVSGQNVKCYDMGNFTVNGTFQTNLDGILDSIATTTSSSMTYGLFNASTSQQQNTEPVEVIGYCHGDLNGDACRACLKASAHEIRQQCPVQKKALFIEQNCTLKYSNGSLYGILDMSQGFIWLSTINQSNWDAFYTGLKKLLDDLRDQASLGGNIRKYAQGTSSVGMTPLYAAVQCSPDLSDQQCSNCLDNITRMLPTGKIGARMLWPSCQFRYEISRFFDPLPSPPPLPSAPSPATTTIVPPPPLTQSGSNSSKACISVGAASGSTVIVVTCILVFLLA